MTNTQHRPDTDLKRSIIEELDWTPSVDPTHIGVAVSAGMVTLSGEVGSYPEKIEAEKAAMRVFGVTGIAQEITVRSAFGPGNDTDMARDAAQAIERITDIPAGSVKVEVHDNVVTLSGAVPWNYQRELAARAVRHLKGVTNVINVVQIKPTASAINIKDAITAAQRHRRCSTQHCDGRRRRTGDAVRLRSILDRTTARGAGCLGSTGSHRSRQQASHQELIPLPSRPSPSSATLRSEAELPS